MTNKVHMEIERKYLLNGFLSDDEIEGCCESIILINQGYLAASDNHSVRVRMSDESCVITEKSGKGMVREENEFEISNGHKYIDDLMKFEDTEKIPRSTTLAEAQAAREWVYGRTQDIPSKELQNVDVVAMDEYVELYEKMVKAGKRSERCKIYEFDVKFAYHIVRLVSECEQILSDHTLVLDEKGRREHMKAVRNGEWTVEQVENHFAQKEKHLEDLYQSSTLQHKPDEEAIKDLLMNCLEHHYGSFSNCVVNEDQATRVLREIAEVVDKNRGLI